MHNRQTLTGAGRSSPRTRLESSPQVTRDVFLCVPAPEPLIVSFGQAKERAPAEMLCKADAVTH